MANRTIGEILAEATPKTVTVRVCLRGDLLARHAYLEQELAAARRLDETENRLPEARGIAEQIQALETEIEGSLVQFTFQCIGQRAWTDLLLEYPPTAEQKEQWREEGIGYGFNPETFPPVAVAKAAIEPKMTEADAESLYRLMSFNEWQRLWGACLAANVEAADVPFSLAASAVLRGYELKSEQPTTTESLDPSS